MMMMMTTMTDNVIVGALYAFQRFFSLTYRYTLYRFCDTLYKFHLLQLMVICKTGCAGGRHNMPPPL